MQMQEDERQSLARELHDEIAQCVTAIHADAVAIRKRGGEPVRESADAIVEVAARIKDMVRRMLQRLRPGALEGMGLQPALRELVADFGMRNPETACTLEVDAGLGAMQGELGITVYRVVQECLTNAARHADARCIDIALAAADGDLVLTVRDDGRGFDESRAHGGFGLLGMRERVKALGGSCSIDSGSGRGTTVRVLLPHARGAA
jgi:two-component system sensor histidine kinase UhpB